MRLKKLTIFGFKSFADKTVLNFDAGVTCIVGPNGCGKSNISDAFRWVLGEQSAKSLRGAKMPDVIFAGTSSRKPLNYAEVSLTLTDVQGSLQIDYEEVTIARRLHRSGESEYLLNGNPVRLKDLQSLFLDSGVGRNAFSIFEQGKLDQVISYSPVERRYIFEEAAGILRFLQKKKDALKRLEQSDLNLSRVNDIHQEVEKQIKTLESQAHKAKIYKEQQGQLEDLEKAGFVLKWQGFEKKQTDLKAKQEKQMKNLEECRRQGEVRQVHAQEARQKKSQHEKTLRTESEGLLTLRGNQELHARECQSLQQRLREAHLREKKLKAESEELALSRKTRQQTMAEISQKRKTLEADWTQAEAKWISQQDRVKSYEKEVIRLREELSLKHQSHLKFLHQHSQWQSDLKQAEVRLENQSGQLKALENRISLLKEDSHVFAKNVQEKKQAMLQISGLVDSHKDRLEQFEEELKKVIAESDGKQKDLEALRKKIMEMKARQKVLLRMRDEHEGFSSGGKKLLQETENRESPLYKILRPFYEFLDPQPEVAEAVAIALRGYAQTLVVEKAEDFKKVLDFAASAGLQDYSLLCLEYLKDFRSNIPAAKPCLHDHVTANPLTGHFLKTIAISATNEKTLKSWIEGKYFEGWSSQGAFIDSKGVLFKLKMSENQVFLRESELKNLEEELTGKESLHDELEQALQHLQHRRSHLQVERGELDKVLRRDEMKLVEVNFSLQRAITDQEKNKAELIRLEQEETVLKETITEQTAAFQTLETQFAAVKEELSRLQIEREAQQLELNKQEGVLRVQELDQREMGTQYQQLADSRQQMIHQFNLLEAKEQDHDNHVKRIEEELEELAEKQAQIKKEEAEVSSQSKVLEAKVKELAEQYEILEKQSEGLQKICEQAEHQLAVHQDDLRRIEHELAQLDMQLFSLHTSLEAVAEELNNRFQLTIEEALQLPLPLNRSLDQTERMIRGLRLSLQEAGDVNLTAIEDLEKHKVRYQFIKQQMDDLQLSKEELLGIIQELTGESHKLFRETFEVIRTNFKKNFQILFNGGEADLSFTDSQDILEAGIEISAKPPGKQMRSISLLSGGEKCLTAVALLFAIFEVKPAPFCILDEIDAPLDDTNVERFVNVVKHFVDRCQFLIITHNKRTMAIGDVIFGVSMEEKGVSKLLSLEFAHREGPEASLV